MQHTIQSISAQRGAVATRHAAPCSTRLPVPLRGGVVMRFREGKDGNPQETQTRDRPQDVIPKQAERLLQGEPLTGQPNTNAVTTDWWQTAFTRRREAMAGRLAMIGVIAAGFGELMFPGHPNIIVQISDLAQWAGLPLGPRAAGIALFALAAYTGFAALQPGSPTWSNENQQDVQKRPAGPPDGGQSLVELPSFMGISGWGFTKTNEIFHGRLAMLGFAGMVVTSLLWGVVDGPGPLAQVARLLGQTPTDQWYANVPGTFFAWSTLAAVLAYVNGKPGSRSGENDIYE